MTSCQNSKIISFLGKIEKKILTYTLNSISTRKYRTHSINSTAHEVHLLIRFTIIDKLSDRCRK